MNLDDAQMAQVRQWVDQGLKVAEIQNRLAESFGMRLTYMEARLLLDDLKLRPKDAPPRPTSGSILTQTPPSPKPAGSLETPGKPAAPAKQAGKVSVTVDEVARPGSLVGGTVNFRDGQTAEWQLDQFGRLAVVPRQPGYKPSAQDVEEFQKELDGVLARLGY